MEPGLAAHQDPAGQLQLPPRSGLHRCGGQKGRCDRPAGVVRPQGRRLRAGSGDGVQRKRRRQGAGPVQLCRVLPVGCRGRQLQLPAQLLHWRGGGGRQRHLPQDRVPRTPQPLRRFLGKLPVDSFDTTRDCLLPGYTAARQTRKPSAPGTVPAALLTAGHRWVRCTST